MIIRCWDDLRYLLRYTFFEKKILHHCNSFLRSQLLHIAIFNSFLAAIAIAIVLMAIANALKLMILGEFV